MSLYLIRLVSDFHMMTKLLNDNFWISWSNNQIFKLNSLTWSTLSLLNLVCYLCNSKLTFGEVFDVKSSVLLIAPVASNLISIHPRKRGDYIPWQSLRRNQSQLVCRSQWSETSMNALLGQHSTQNIYEFPDNRLSGLDYGFHDHADTILWAHVRFLL